MATAAPNANINIPYSAFLDPTTGRPSQPWLQWLMNPSVISINLGTGLAVTSGGTGLTTIPTNGQLLIGNGTGYSLNTLGVGACISVTNGSGTISVANTGVLSFSCGATGLTPSAATTGAVTLAGTLIAVNGGTGFSSYAVGDLLYANTTTTLAKLADVAIGNALISGGVATAPAWGKIGLTTHVSGILPIVNGGTNGTATPTAYGISYGTGTAYAFTSAGTDKQVLKANTGAAPTWTTLTTGTSILYGDNTGGFSNVTIGSGISFIGGTLSATGSGGTVTSVSVVSANGFAGTVATATTTPAITLATTVTGLLKGNGTAISAAVANTDYVPLSTVLTKTADYTITGTDTWIINNKTGSALTLTFPAASSWTGRSITVKNMQAQLVNSASSNIVPIDSTTAGTAILLGVIGNWATMVSDGTNWVIMQAASNNNLLLE